MIPQNSYNSFDAILIVPAIAIVICESAIEQTKRIKLNVRIIYEILNQYSMNRIKNTS